RRRDVGNRPRRARRDLGAERALPHRPRGRRRLLPGRPPGPQPRPGPRPARPAAVTGRRPDVGRRRGGAHVRLGTLGPSATVAAHAPYVLVPGAASAETAMLCLLERHHDARIGANLNMDVDLASIPDDVGGYAAASPSERAEVSAWLDANWPNWKAEALRAL